jgi:predicted 2-oxoglutarate/Fe(II)-dependent dioxygenase YbiX
MYIPPLPIEPTEIVAGCIAIYRDVWDNPQETINTIEQITSNPTSNVTFTKANLSDGRYDDHRTNSHLSLTEAGKINEEFRILNNKYFDLLFSATNYYTNKFINNDPYYFIEQFNLLKYQTGQEYKAHFDGGTQTRRSISPILYLNDEYTGGELEFVFHDIKIKPSPGMLVIFPANYAYSHIAHPVKTGTKYAIVTWLHDQPGQ